MFNVLPVLLKDGYKIDHRRQYPTDTTLVYSNLTPRKSRTGFDSLLAYGMQYLVAEYLVNQFNANFFNLPIGYVAPRYQRRINNYLGPNKVGVDHIVALHKLGYLPLQIKAVPEGTLVPMRAPIMTIKNTKKEFFWLTNMLETLISATVWGMSTSATTAFRYRQVFEKYCSETGGDPAFVKWQGHDFSMRGMFGVEAALMSASAHLLSFTGSDTLPAVDFLEQYYGANSDSELVAGSVSATEHSVMSMGSKAGERDTTKRLITEVYPNDEIISIVCDTWDFWNFITVILPSLKAEVMARSGKVVVRPDSGDPVKIICGDPDSPFGHVRAGAIEVLGDKFGYTTNEAGYKQLVPQVGLIYGDSITPERQLDILEGLKAKGWASTNVVLGIGSFTYQHVTRDTYGLAMKATYGETTSGGPQMIFKDPATDDGTKKSATGLLRVARDRDGKIFCAEKQVWEQEAMGLLQTIFHNGMKFNTQTLATIRARVEAQL